MQLIKNIIYNLLSLQEKYLERKLSKTIGAKNFSKRKRHFSQGVMLDLASLAEEEKNKFEEEISSLLKDYDYNPDKLLEYIQSQGTPVYRLKNSKEFLALIKETEGFVLPAKGLKAFYISFGTVSKPSFETKECFIIPFGNLNKYYFIYHFYNWFAFKHNIAGMNADSRTLLNKFLFETADTSNLHLDDIYKLKDAIKQDKASIEFVVKLCRNFEGAKKASEKINKEGGAQI